MCEQDLKKYYNNIIMDIITIDGKQYDPYFILDVTKDDSIDDIKRSFRQKVKKYHPDKYTDPLKKQKYEKYFKILSESYEYIKNKRQDSFSRNKSKKINSKKSSDETILMKKEKLDDFNKTFEKTIDPNYFGYGEDYTRMERVEDYEDIDIKLCNQFENKKFTTKEFNRLFEYNKNTQDDDKDKIITKSMIHKTTDGFFGYNTSDITNCALVSTFNGLLVTGDDFGEGGVGYWGNNYSDYKFSYKTSKNPNSKIILPKSNDIVINKVTQQEISKYKNEYDKINRSSSGNYSQQQNILYKNTYEDLVKKELQDKNMVLKYIKQYDDTTVKKALSGELPESPKYISALRKYIRE